MIKVLPAVFSYEEMKNKWNQDNPNEPYGRSDSLQNGIYAIENWLIRVDDNNKAIATGGWTEYPTHTVVGGLYAVERADRNHPEHDPKLSGNARAIQDAREPQLNKSKPIIASFNQQRGNNARWMATAKNTQGFIFSDDPKWEQAISVLPQELVKEWTEKSGDRWAIRNILNSEELAKCVYPDDPTASWFNLLKYLPDNTWDDFELGEPAPDLGTRDRFKDKNIKSKGNAKYKAFVSEKYLRQVSDRIPNAGTSLMQGWLEKLTEMNLNKGKYWFFGTNVREDNTYVMIDVISKGQTYTLTSDKRLNLEGMDKAIIFVGVSKEMVGKVKRGQNIPKGRKFLDIHGKYGMRGLKRERRLPKEPTNPFKAQDIEKSWKDIFKWRPDGSFSSQGPKGDFVPKDYRTGTGGKYSSLHNTMITGHYLDGGEIRGKFKNFLWKHFNRTDMIEEWVSLLREQPDDLLTAKSKNKIWFWCVPDEDDYSYVDARVIMPRGDMLEKRFIFESIRIKDPDTNTWMGAPLTYAQFIPIWGVGEKEGAPPKSDSHNPMDIGRQKQQKSQEPSIFDNAVTSDEVYEIWKKWYEEHLQKIKQLKNKIENATKQETKIKAFTDIDKIDKKIRKQYEEYKKYHEKFYKEDDV